MSNSTASYKQLKEDFVSNLSGGTVTEIYYVTAVAPVCPFLSLQRILEPQPGFSFMLILVPGVGLPLVCPPGSPVLLQALYAARLLDRLPAQRRRSPALNNAIFEHADPTKRPPNHAGSLCSLLAGQCGGAAKEAPGPS